LDTFTLTNNPAIQERRAKERRTGERRGGDRRQNDRRAEETRHNTISELRQYLEDLGVQSKSDNATQNDGEPDNKGPAS
jgi:hypothetical protein